MLSRLALKSVSTPTPIASVLFRGTQTSATNNNAAITEGPERDLVNFPRRVRLDRPKVRMALIPEEFFQMFYKKTGVTGPYMFGVGLLTFLCSKEIYVMEHEFYNGLSLLLIMTIGYQKLSPAIEAWMDKEITAEEEKLRDLRDIPLAGFNTSIEDEKQSQLSAEASSMLLDAKKENVAIQLETAYRQRLVEAHKAVKAKLDYQLTINQVKTRVEQEHMVNWITDQVRKAITPAQEAAALKKCIGDLKGLAAVA